MTQDDELAADAVLAELPDSRTPADLASGLAADALAAALLAAADALGLPLAIKEIAGGRYVHLNAPMAAWLAGAATPPRALLGLTDAEWLDAVARQPLQAAEQAAASAAGPVSSEHRFDRNGEKRDFTVVRQALTPTGARAPRWLLGVWRETTREKRLEAQLQRALAQIEAQQQQGNAAARQPGSAAAPPQPGLRDAETGLYQASHFDDQLRREVDLSSREHREFALVAITLDPLAGPAAAARTRVLEALGRLLASNTRAMDGACRLSDDRFAILLSGVGLATAHARMEGLRRQCATQIVVHEGRSLGFTVSMGVASFPHTAHTQQELLDAADSALREAQRRGGNHVTLASIRFETP